RHGRPGVPRVRGLDRVDSESADRVDAEFVEWVPARLDARALVDRDRHALPPGAAIAPLAAPAASKMFTHSRLRRAISLIAASRAIRPSVPFPLNQHTSARRSR